MICLDFYQVHTYIAFMSLSKTSDSQFLLLWTRRRQKYTTVCLFFFLHHFCYSKIYWTFKIDWLLFNVTWL